MSLKLNYSHQLKSVETWEYFLGHHVGGEENVVYLDQDIDVQWYARQCTRFLRQIQVPGQSGFENIVLKQKVNQAYEGTKFCSRFGSNYNPKYNEGNDAPEMILVRGCKNAAGKLRLKRLSIKILDGVICTFFLSSVIC